MTDIDVVEVSITAPDRDWLIDLCHQLVKSTEHGVDELQGELG